MSRHMIPALLSKTHSAYFVFDRFENGWKVLTGIKRTCSDEKTLLPMATLMDDGTFIVDEALEVDEDSYW